MITNDNQRIIIGMYDGFGLDYLEASSMPNLNGMIAQGFYKEVKAVLPTVTNANNVSICCGCRPNDHGITGNSYFNEANGECDYMENSDFILVPTVIQRAASRGIKSALLTCKVKTLNLLSGGAEIAIAAETPSVECIEKYGEPPDIYTSEINYWLWEVAIDILKNRPEIGLIYVHTTDFPMHAWGPREKESLEHMAALDRLLGEARDAAPDAAFFITADHGMNYKNRCWDLVKACGERGLELRFALSAERDKYLKHHRSYGGTAWVWLKSPTDSQKAIEIIKGLAGVEEVLTREVAANRFKLMPERIGELVVIGDIDTVFGENSVALEVLEPGYRSHGSLHEMDVPLIIYNQSGTLPKREEFSGNADLTRFLADAWR
jgi:phosphonoacetate hydrolase